MSGDLDPTRVAAALEARAATLRDALLAKVEANLSGAVLRSRSGALAASIGAELSASADAVAVDVASVGVPYAAIQEYGGVTSPHDILPVKALALAFAGAGGTSFARRVHHPGSVIPARSYLGAALDECRGEILGGLKDAVRDALGAG